MVLVLLILSIPAAAFAGGIVLFLGYGLLASIFAYSLAGSAAVLLMGMLIAVGQRPSQLDKRIENYRSQKGRPNPLHASKRIFTTFEPSAPRASGNLADQRMG